MVPFCSHLAKVGGESEGSRGPLRIQAADDLREAVAPVSKPAVSQVFNLRRIDKSRVIGNCSRLSTCKSASPQVGSLRYFRSTGDALPALLLFLMLCANIPARAGESNPLL